jgi:hypothetical protein
MGKEFSQDSFILDNLTLLFFVPIAQ